MLRDRDLWEVVGGLIHFFWVEVFFVARHVLCQTEDLHLLPYSCLDHLLEGVFGMAGAELAGVAVVREWHLEEGQRCCRVGWTFNENTEAL